MKDLFRPGLTVAIALIAIVALGVSDIRAEEEGEVSLYERLGGLPAISVVVSEFIDELVPDEQLNQNPAIAEARERVPAPYLKYHVTAMVCQATGGPCTYTGRPMDESHAHLNITEAEWDHMVEIFLGILADHNVPQAEVDELVAIVGSTKEQIVTGGE